MLKGKQLKLGPLREKDIEILAGWYEDATFLRYYDYNAAVPKTKEQLAGIYKNGGNEKFIPFAVRKIDDDSLIGLIEIDNISFNNRFAWLSIGLGEETQRGKGFGYEAMSLAIRFAFDELNLERLQLNVIAYNEAAIKLYEKLGFKREGAYRELVLRDGVRSDLYLYGLLKREWKGNDV
ncbi:MAG: GNAT family protein [Clostridia bacterium]|nr:GNAT family protein [Clostridia bacterium]